ncbi:MAG: hypothetical protein JMN25_00350 [gamma proteobacterium endosymbiont of Lamellibrachia anaximandri]|nr:hypothetical protein [gamma proteobacterium endosymbiont of Lamellibrachia anaximandri]
MLLFTFQAIAETVDREAVGSGLTRQEAVSNALIEALKQTSGVKIDAEQAQTTIQKELHMHQDEAETNVGMYAQRRVGKINYKTSGVIQQYEIVSVDQAADGLYEAIVRVQTEVYKTPGFAPKNRRSLAVMPPHTLQNRYVFSGYSVRHDEFSRRLQQALITELTQARRFSIMDRDYKSEYLREKHLLAGPDSAISEYAKIGQVLGVDYMVASTVTDAELKKSSHTIAALGETRSTHTGRFRVEYRIIVMATRQIKWSGTSDIDFSGNRVPGKLINKGEALADHMIATVAKDINRQILNNIYPLQLVKISANGNLILNQGGVTVKQGERYTIFSLGEEIFDPYTKELLGREETQVGTAEITSINPKYSVARLVKGNKSSIAEGMLLRFPKRVAVLKKKPMKVQTPAW